METTIYGERIYPRTVWKTAVFVDFQTLCQIVNLNTTSTFRLLKKMEVDNMLNEHGQKIVFSYLNRKYYLESFAFDFWKEVGKRNLL